MCVVKSYGVYRTFQAVSNSYLFMPSPAVSQLPRQYSALPSTNVPQLFYDASVFLIAGTDKDKQAPFPSAGVICTS